METIIHRAPPSPAAPGFLDAFVAAFPTLRQLREACLGAGLLIVTLHERGAVTGHAHLTDDGEHVVLGRHYKCRLRVAGDPSLSMRHAVLVLARRADGVELQAWATGPTGMCTEDGGCHDTLTTRGPAAFTIGATRVFVFPTGPGVPAWTADPATTWAALPPRRTARGTVFPVRPGASFDGDDPTAAVDGAHAALRVRARPVGAEVVGVLRLAQGSLGAHIPVTAHGVERGVLLGRGDRCDAGGRFAGLSRLHAIVIGFGDGLWLYDAASHNGIQRAGAPVARCRLDDGEAVSLGGALTVSWHPRPR